MKLSKIILSLTMLLTTSLAEADNYQYLTVDQTGTQTSFEVSQIQKITFDTSDMVLMLASGGEQRLPLTSLNKMFFSESGINAVAAPAVSKSAVVMENGQLKVNVAEGEQVTLYNTKGEVVFAVSQPAVFNISQLQKGVYVVKIGSQTRKILNK